MGGRKFIIALLVITFTTVLLWFTKVDQDTYKLIILSITGGYLTSNVANRTIGVLNGITDKTKP